jgi:hypothetical protein
MYRSGSCLLALLAWFTPRLASAAEEPAQRKLTPEEVEAWLDSRSLPTGDQGASSDEVPPPPPRHHGLVIESSLGALGHLGPMKHVSPTAPWFLTRIGFEPFRWLMLFAEGDVSFASTAYASQPPPPRTYWLYGLGGGVRFTFGLGEHFGVFVQGSVGGASISEQDVLEIYGYENASDTNAYYGGMLGLEWYQVSPHFALAVHGGVRQYNGLDRSRSSEGPAAWLSAAALRYAF